jgi:hypothetical protein
MKSYMVYFLLALIVTGSAIIISTISGDEMIIKKLRQKLHSGRGMLLVCRIRL